METGAPLNCPNQMVIVALGGLEVCDGGHRLAVMKKDQRPGPRKRLCAGEGESESGTLQWELELPSEIVGDEKPLLRAFKNLQG